MELLEYFGTINLAMQITFVVVILLSMKVFKYTFNEITIGIVRLVISGLILTGLVFALIYFNKPKPVLKNELLSKTQLENIVIEQARRYGVPITIATSLVTQESQWRPRVVSKAQAAGLCQILPSTWVAYTDSNNIFCPTENAKVAMHYLSDLHKKYKRWDYALGHYNAGGYNKECKEARLYVASVLSRADYK